MRRILLLLAVAAMMAMMLALTVSPALAQTDIPPPGPETPGNPQTPTENPAAPTKEVGKNCNGQSASKFVKGPGGNPGSAASPSPEFNNFNGPFVSDLVRSDQTPGGGNLLSEFQQSNREASGLCRATR